MTTPLRTNYNDGGLVAPTPGNITAADMVAISTDLNTVRGLPSYVTAAANRYDPPSNWYNLKGSNTRAIRAGLAKARAGTGASHHIIFGDSISSFFTGTANVANHLHMWSYVMRDRLKTAGVPVGGTGVVVCADAAMTAGDNSWLDPRWSLNIAQWTNGVTYLQSNAVATATFTSDQAGTIVDLTYGNPGTSFTVAIDGGAPVTVTTTTAFNFAHYTVTGLANTTHTVVITGLGATTVLAGISVNGTTGLIVDKISASGCAASDIANNVPGGSNTDILGKFQARMSTLPAGMTPDAVWLELGTNDVDENGQTNAATAASLTTIANQFPNSDVVLIGNFGVSGGDTIMDSWVGALYGLADTLNVPLLDLRDRLGNSAVANTAGLIGADGEHYSLAGQTAFGTAAAHPFI